MSADRRKLAIDDLARFMRGQEPPADVQQSAPILDLYRVLIARTPSGYRMFLRGVVRGHPRHPDGASIETTEIVWLDRKHRWARSINRVYLLDGEAAEID